VIVLSAFAAMMLAQSAPCPVTLPNGTAVRGGFVASRNLPDFTIRNREHSHVLVKLEPSSSSESHVYFIAPGADMTIRGVPLGSYAVSVAVAGRFGPDCRTLVSAKAIYRYDDPFVFTRAVTENEDGSRDIKMEGHWIELGNDGLLDARAKAISVDTFNG